MVRCVPHTHTQPCAHHNVGTYFGTLFRLVGGPRRGTWGSCTAASRWCTPGASSLAAAHHHATPCRRHHRHAPTPMPCCRQVRYPKRLCCGPWEQAHYGCAAPGGCHHRRCPHLARTRRTLTQQHSSACPWWVVCPHEHASWGQSISQRRLTTTAGGASAVEATRQAERGVQASARPVGGQRPWHPLGVGCRAPGSSHRHSAWQGCLRCALAWPQHQARPRHRCRAGGRALVPCCLRVASVEGGAGRLSRREPALSRGVSCPIPFVVPGNARREWPLARWHTLGALPVATPWVRRCRQAAQAPGSVVGPCTERGGLGSGRVTQVSHSRRSAQLGNQVSAASRVPGLSSGYGIVLVGIASLSRWLWIRPCSGA